MRRAYGRAPQRRYFVGSSEGGREGTDDGAALSGRLRRHPEPRAVIHWTGLQHAGLRDGLALADGGWLDATRVKRVHRGGARRVRTAPTGSSTASSLGPGRLPRALRRAHAAVPARRARRRLPDRTAGRRGPHARRAARDGGAARQRARRVSGPRARRRGPARDRARGRLDGVVDRRFAASFPPAAVERHRVVLRCGRDPVVLRARPEARPAHLPAARPRGADPRGVGDDGLDRPGPVGVPRPRRPADRPREHGRLRAEPVRGHPLRRVGDRDARAGAHGRVPAPVRRSRRRPRRHRAPANAALFDALVAWVEDGRPPGAMRLVEQATTPPFAVLRSRPLCRWPEWPRHVGGDPSSAASFACGR